MSAYTPHERNGEWWETAYREMGPRLYHFFFAYTRGDAAAAEDLVHETFVSAISGYHRFDSARGPFHSWLWTIARRRMTDLLRSRNGSAISIELVEEKLAGLADSLPLPDELLAREEVRLRIGGALAELPELYQLILRSKYIDDRSVREIAHAINKSEKAVESLLTRARGAFCRQFNMDGGEDSP